MSVGGESKGVGVFRLNWCHSIVLELHLQYNRILLSIEYYLKLYLIVRVGKNPGSLSKTQLVLWVLSWVWGYLFIY